MPLPIVPDPQTQIVLIIYLLRLNLFKEIIYKAPVNCFKNFKSFSLNKRRSFIWYFNIVILSMPIPKAKPEYLSLSIPQFSNSLGCAIPQPKISTQPVCLQTLQPAPPHIKQLISISALGSVKGK